MSESDLKGLIKEYLIETDLKETLHDSKLELGFRFVFPKGLNPQGKPVGRPFTIVKAANREVLEISSPIKISQEHIDAFNSMEKGTKERFFKNLSKTLFLKEVFFNIDTDNNRFAIIDNIFLRQGEVVSKNEFFNSVRKVLGCVLFSILELQDFCSGEFDVSDLKLIP